MKKLINPYIDELKPYRPGRHLEEVKRKYNIQKVIKLASNENPLPLPKNVAAAIKDEVDRAGLYPDSSCYTLKKRIAEYNRVKFENVVVSAGLVEAIKMIMLAFLKPGETVLTSEKTFTLYRIATIERLGQKAYIEAEMDPEYRFDLDRIYSMIDESTKMIIITNPNNPTGTMVSRQKLLDFINRVPEEILIVLDNAYHEYVTKPDDYLHGIDLAVERKNVIVLRTFSKIYALAGLRVGYAIANPDTIAYLNLVKAPFSVSSVAQKAALVSLENEDFKIMSAELNQKNKEKLFRQLQELGLRVMPSETNFLFFIPELDTLELNERLLREGVIIRPLHPYGAPEGMRVTIGSEEDNTFFITKLKKVLSEF